MNYQELLGKVDKSAITQWAKNDTYLHNGPWLCYIGITNICNSRCAICAHSKVMRPEKGCMNIETFKKIVDELPRGVQKIYLMKQGEPLINKNIELFVDYLRDSKPSMHISFHTNGIIARKKRIAKIIPKITSLGISTNAISSEVYKKAHRVNKFHLVMRNLKGLSDLLMEMPNEQRPSVFIDYVVQKANKSERKEEVVQFYRKNFPWLESIDFHWVYNFQGEIEEGNMEIYDKLPFDKFPCCVFPWSSISFCYDGKVSYCFVEPRENRFLGDITKQTFAEIWNGEEYQLFRKRMAEKKFGELSDDGLYCNKCSWLWSMHSQSPRNLNYGYSAKLKDSFHCTSFGQLLDLPLELVLEIGVDLYLKGEIHQALGCFYIISPSCHDHQLLEAAKEMRLRCEKVLKKYKHLSLWREMMQNEGLTSDRKSRQYYPIGEN